MKTKPDGSTSAVPSGRLSRLLRMGSLASGIAGNLLSEGARQLAKGKHPRLSDLLLTPGNVQRVADQLAQLRGAAMKVGQLLSMDAGDLLPPELSQLLARLRSDAHHMPRAQLVKVLSASWGKDWEKQFTSFSFTPMAAASIGQVHAAQTLDGKALAIKIQYPGVRRSISSDVDNVTTLLRLSGLLPKQLDVAPLIKEAKRQLHQEADYLKEAEHLAHYRTLLADSPDYTLPEVFPDWCRPNILAMSYVRGEPIESVHEVSAKQRNRVAGLLFDLLFREIFVFHHVQTDPNFANYRYDHESDRLVLLDFGATRAYSKKRAEAYRQLLTAGMRNDLAGLEGAATDIGYFQADIADRHKQIVLSLFITACEPLRHEGAYDFAQSDLAQRIHALGMRLGRDRDFWHTPPVDAIFLHRKIIGLYLLAAQLRARVDMRGLFAPYASA